MRSGSAFALFVLVADMLAATVLALFMVGAMMDNQGHRAGWFALACAAEAALRSLGVAFRVEGE